MLELALCALVPLQSPPTTHDRALGVLPEGIELQGPQVADSDGEATRSRARIVFAPGGLGFATVGWQDGAARPVVGGAVGRSWTFLSAPVFSADGRHVAFRAGESAGNDLERWGVLLDGADEILVGESAWIGEIAFAPADGSLVWWERPQARIAIDGSYTHSVERLVRARPAKNEWKLTRGKEWDDVGNDLRPRFAADGATVLATVAKDGQWRILASDGRRERELADGFYAPPTFDCDPKLKRTAVTRWLENKKGWDLPEDWEDVPLDFAGKYVVVVGKEAHGAEADSAFDPRFDPFGKRLAYKVSFEGRLDLAVSDEKRGADARFGHVFDPIWRPDGRELAYVAVSGSELPAAIGFPGSNYVPPNGSWTVQWRAVDGGKPSKALGEVAIEIRDLVWRADGQRLAWRARAQDGWRVVVAVPATGQVLVSAYAEQVGAPEFRADGRAVEFGALQDRNLTWRSLELP